LVATNKNKPEKGDVLVTRIGNIGFSAVVAWDYEFSIYVTLAVIKKDKKFISGYLHGYMQSERYQREIQSKSLLNAVPCKINMDELRKTEVLFPSLEEQQKIADCLSSIDDLIAAQAQKIEELKAHKKGLMQQLFPAMDEVGA
jgi:type I restriction enzyme S subunit